MHKFKITKPSQDLYSLIGSMAYDVAYEDALEFYPEKKKLEVEGKEIICGRKEITNVEGKTLRQQSKPILIGSIYQRGITSIAEQISATKDEAKEIMDRFYKAFPTITAWMEERKQFVLKNGYIANAIGRIRHLPDATLPLYSIEYVGKKGENIFNPFLNCGNKTDVKGIRKYELELKSVKSLKDYEKIQKEALDAGIAIHNNQAKIAQAQRQAVNYPCQSLGADVAKVALINLGKDPEMQRLGFRVLIQVHDEFIGECPKENAEAVAKRLTEIMLSSASQLGIDVPMSADTYIVSNWYADEVSSSILSTFLKLTGKGISEEEALKEIYEEHSELYPENIYNFLIKGEELVI